MNRTIEGSVSALRSLKNRRLEENIMRIQTFCELHRSEKQRRNPGYIEELIAVGNALEDFRYTGVFSNFESQYDSQSMNRVYNDLAERLFVHVEHLTREQAKEFHDREDQFLSDDNILKEFFRYTYIDTDTGDICDDAFEDRETFDESMDRQLAIDRIMQGFLPQ